MSLTCTYLGLYSRLVIVHWKQFQSNVFHQRFSGQEVNVISNGEGFDRWLGRDWWQITLADGAGVEQVCAAKTVSTGGYSRPLEGWTELVVESTLSVFILILIKLRARFNTLVDAVRMVPVH